MAEFKEILRFERVDESGNVLQAEDIDLRRGIVGEEDPSENTPGMAGLLYYVVRDGKITAEYVCVAAEEGVYTWKKKKSGAVDDTLTVPGAAADAKAVGDKVAELSGAIADLDGNKLPDYYTDYMAERIETVKNLMDEVGADGTVFIDFLIPTWNLPVKTKTEETAENLRIN